MNFSQMLLNDPILLIEVFTVVCLFAFVVKLCVLDAPQADHGLLEETEPLPAIPFTLDFCKVGSLISLPKQSLAQQHPQPCFR